MKIRRIAIVILLILLLCPSAFTEMSADAVSCYEEGLLYFEFEDYTSAIELFEQADKYKDSKKWKQYCQALLYIESGDIAMAAAELKPLSERKFELAEQWLTYCYARDAQSIGNYYYARSLYLKIDVGDSYERYTDMHERITNGVIEPEETKVSTAPVKTPIPARTTAYISIYLGPGSNFVKLPFKLDVTDEIAVFDGYRSGSSSWYMIGFEKDGAQYRAWASTARVNAEWDVPWAATARIEKKTLTKDIKPLYGPSADFKEHDFTLVKGALVSVCGAEGDFSMAEIIHPETNAPMYTWFPTNTLK